MESTRDSKIGQNYPGLHVDFTILSVNTEIERSGCFALAINVAGGYFCFRKLIVSDTPHLRDPKPSNVQTVQKRISKSFVKTSALSPGSQLSLSLFSLETPAIALLTQLTNVSGEI